MLRWDPAAETVDRTLISQLAERPPVLVENLEGCLSARRVGCRAGHQCEHDRRTGQAGLFILRAGHRCTLWDFRPPTPVLLAEVCDEPGAYACHVQDGSIHTLLPQHVPIDVVMLGILG